MASASISLPSPASATPPISAGIGQRLVSPLAGSRRYNAGARRSTQYSICDCTHHTGDSPSVSVVALARVHSASSTSSRGLSPQVLLTECRRFSIASTLLGLSARYYPRPAKPPLCRACKRSPTRRRDPPQPAVPVLRPAHAAHRRLLRRSGGAHAESRPPRAGGRRVRPRVLPVAAVRAEPDVDAHRPPPVRAGVLDQRRLPALRCRHLAAQRGRRRLPARCSPAACTRWGRTSCTATPSAWSATTARTGAACRATTWACSTRPTIRGARASIARASASPRTRSRTSRPRDAACDYLRAAGEARRAGSDTPFCLTVGFLLPHPPYVAWREDYERFAGRVPPPAHGAPPSPPHAWEAWWRENRDIAQRRRRGGRCARAPRTTGSSIASTCCWARCWQCLAAEGLDDDTLVVYSTDHGDQLGERGLWWKHTLYEDSVRVPLVLRWPGMLPAGERRAQLVDLLDVAATMSSALGGPALPLRPRPQPAAHRARCRARPGSTRCSASTAPTTSPRGPAGRRRSSGWCAAARGSSSTRTATRRSSSISRDDPHERHDLAADPQHAARARSPAGARAGRLGSRARGRAHRRAPARQERPRRVGAPRAARPTSSAGQLLPEHNRLEPMPD